MPGIFGAYRKNWNESPSELMRRMSRTLDQEGSLKLRTDLFVDDAQGLFVGRASLGVLNPVHQPVSDARTGCWIVFHGELYSSSESLSDPEYVLGKYLEKGDGCASDLDGVFHFALMDSRSGQLKLFSDKFGLQPLYYAVQEDGMLFAGEVKALLEDRELAKEADLRSLADFFHYGQVLGDKTLFRDIRLLGPGCVLTYDLKEGKTTLGQYFHLHGLFSEKGAYDPEVSPEEVVSLLVGSIRDKSRNRDVLGLSLSGGLDSRGILAGLGEEATGIHTYTLGLPGCADQGLSERMSRVAGTIIKRKLIGDKVQWKR